MTPEPTIRETINKRVRARMLLSIFSPLLAILGVVGGFALGIRTGMPDAVILGVAFGAGFVVFCVCRMLGSEPWLCPTCRRKMLPSGAVSGCKDNMFEMPKEFRFCPYCGQSFDEPMPEKG